MSNKAQSWAWSQSTVLASDKFVLVALADHAWDDGTHAWPSLETLCEKTNLSRRTVYAALQRLEDTGYIVKAETPRQHKPAVYSLLLDRGAATAPLDDPQTGNHCTGAAIAPVQPPHSEVQLTVARGATTALREAMVAPEVTTTDLTTTKELHRTRATRVPEDFVITSELRAKAAKDYPLVDVDHETAQWIDHHLAKGDTATRWINSWHKWMRNSQKWTKEKPRGSSRPGGFQPYQNPTDQSVYDQPLEAS